jgi:hypothetical protein
VQSGVAPIDSAEGGPGVPIAATAQGGNTSNAATLTAVAGSTTYLKRGLIIVGGATAGAAFVATLTGLIGGTLSFPVETPVGATAPIVVIPLDFGEGFEAATPASNIVLTLPALGAGNTTAGVFLWGIQIPD